MGCIKLLFYILVLVEGVQPNLFSVFVILYLFALMFVTLYV